MFVNVYVVLCSKKIMSDFFEGVKVYFECKKPCDDPWANSPRNFNADPRLVGRVSRKDM
jgi:hypothetical protein